MNPYAVVANFAATLPWFDGQPLCAEADPEAWFPEQGGSVRDAKKVCDGCELRAPCLEYALTNGIHFGVWGGLSEHERRPMVAARRRLALGEVGR